MPKQKTKSGAKKRFKISAGGKLLRRHAMRSHNLEKKSSKRKRAHDRVGHVHPRDARSIRKLLGL